MEGWKEQRVSSRLTRGCGPMRLLRAGPVVRGTQCERAGRALKSVTPPLRTTPAARTPPAAPSKMLATSSLSYTNASACVVVGAIGGGCKQWWCISGAGHDIRRRPCEGYTRTREKLHDAATDRQQKRAAARGVSLPGARTWRRACRLPSLASVIILST